MLSFIKLNYLPGDSLEVTTTDGLFYGTIVYVTDQFIILRQPNEKVIGIAANNVLSFKADFPAELKVEATEAPTTGVDEWVAPTEATSAPAADAATPEAPTTAPTDEATSSTSIKEPKVIGHIDLEKLHRIDPRLARKQYFKSQPKDDTATDADPIDADAPHLDAMGYVTFCNNDHRYGFIHDEESGNDLYFNYNQVVAPIVFDHMRKGLGLCYSIERNNHGYVAVGIHLPDTVDNLLLLIDDLIGRRRYFYARQVCQHLLSAFPDDQRAQAALEEIESLTPTGDYNNRREGGNSNRPADNRPNRNYQPALIYMQAKNAFLDKEFDKAETLYLEALEAGQKPDSCVKDLITLYVSLYKLADTDELRAEARTKAKELLAKHEQLLPDNLSTRQFIALNYLLPMQQFEEFLELITQLLEEPQVKAVRSREVFYLWQKGLILFRLGRLDEAQVCAEQGLQLSPYSRQLQNLRENILHPELHPNYAGSTDEAPSEDAAPSEDEAPAEEPIAASEPAAAQD